MQVVNNIDLNIINTLVLHKQHLMNDSGLDDIVQVVRDIGGLHATSITTPYLSLFARCRDFKKERLDEELYAKRTLGKIRCVRKTIYILPKDMLPIAHRATTSMVEDASRRFLEFQGVSSKEYAAVAKTIVEMLKGGEMTASAIKKALKTQSDVSAVLNLMCDQGLLIRGRPAKGWKDRNQQYALFSDYFPDVDLGHLTESEATTLLVRQYVSSFGPVTENDIVWWTGINKTRVRAALSQLQAQIIRVNVSGLEGDFLLLRTDASLIEHIEPPQRPTVNLLPELDPFLMGYKERARYLDRRYYERIFDRSGNATSTILLEGRVVGVWDFEQDRESVVKLFLFEKVELDVLRTIYAAAQRVGKFMADQDVRLRECSDMIPLTKRPAGAVMSPLKDC